MTFINLKWLAIALLLANIPLSACADEKKLDLFEVVKATMDNSPVLKIQGYQVDVAKAAERIQSGAFNVRTSLKVSNDTTKNSLYVPGETYTEVATPRPPVPPTVLGAADVDTQSFQAAAQQKSRSGITTRLQYDLIRRDPVGISTTPVDYFYGTTSRGKVGLTVTVPLLKGAWEVSNAAAEKSADVDYQVAIARYKQLITKTLLDTVKAYWSYTAAHEILNQRIIIKDRIEKLSLANPSNEFLVGFLQEKQGKVVTATQNLEQARIALALVMGIPVDDALKLGTPDANNFPANPETFLQHFDSNKAKQEWVGLALENRNDLRAAKLNVESIDILLARDHQDLYPELTAAVGVGYNGITHGNGFENYVDSSYRHVRDFDHNAALTFNYPIGNDAAEGTYDRDYARKMSNIVSMNETARGIKLSIENSVAQVHGRLKVVVQAQKTWDSYRDSLLDLFKKSNLTNAEDVSNIVVLQQKLEDAMVAYITAQADYANAVAQARFETGVLISNADNSDLNADINIEKISALPSLAQQ
jgi:outer membrane protein TolC